MMKSIFKSFFTFSRKEQYGIIGLISLICIVFAISFFIRNFIQPKVNIDEEKLNIAWQKIQAKQQTETAENTTSASTSEPFYFDPNTLDSSGFIQLGLSAKTTKYLLNWRNKGKHFYKKEDLKPLYSLSEIEYNRLAPYIQIKESERSNNYTTYEKQAPLPAHINLNKTDSGTLVRLKGIGPFLAQKIIGYRDALGGFINHNQLLEIYKFPDSTFNFLKEKLVINSVEIRKRNINTATESELNSHPYIDEKMAKNILLMRKGLNKYENISQLRQVPLMNEEKYRKIASYCTID